jgi:glycosyltransferase involved in cell wall biosynthesis
MKVLLVLPMVPQADGLGAIPKLLHAQLLGLQPLCELTVLGTFGELPGQAETAAELVAAGLDVHFADRRRARSARRRWRVRAELASSWARRSWPWRAVSLSAGVQPLLDRLVAERRFDVIALEDNSFSVLRLPAATPLVLTEHEAMRAPPRGPGPVPLRARPAAALEALDWRRWESFQPRAWAGADLVQAYSRGDAARIAARAPALAARVRVDPYGIELPAPSQPGPEAAETILFTGTFTHPPNRDAARLLAREIMPALRPLRPRARLRIVGSAPPADLLDLAAPDIEIVADAPAIAPHLAAAAVVVAPVRSGGGMRLKVLEAMAAGKVVVTTGLGAEGYVELDPEPPLVVAETSGQIAAAVADLLADPARRRQLGGRAREFARTHYSPEAWGGRLIEVYREARALRGGGPRG